MKKEYFSIGAVILSGMAIPISTALQNIGFVFLIGVFYILHNSYDALKKAITSPFPLVGLALGFYAVAGLIWTSANFDAALEFIWKLRPYYFAAIFFVIFGVKRFRNWFLISFLLAVLFSVLLSCVSALINHPFYKGIPGDWFVFRTHTYHNFFAAIIGSSLLAALLAMKLSFKAKVMMIIALIVISFDIFFLVVGRTGQIIYLIMLTLVFFLWNWRRGLIASIALIGVLSVVLPSFSPAFNFGLNSAKSDLEARSQGLMNTSIGLRMVWQENAIKLIKEKPLLGHGTGSFTKEYQRVTGSANTPLATENPHNDYLWLGVELGIIGGLLLLGLLVAAAWQGRHLKPAWRWTLYALLLGMGISTLANSFFTDNITGLAFVLLTSALLNGDAIERETHD